MKIIVQSIDKEIIQMYSDDQILEARGSNKYNVGFIIAVDGSFIDSSFNIRHNGNLSFDEAEKIIKEKFSRDGGQ